MNRRLRSARAKPVKHCGFFTPHGDAHVRAECLLALLECSVPNASPRSKVACGKSRDRLIDRANVAHCSGSFAEAVQLRRKYAIKKDAARARRR